MADPLKNFRARNAALVSGLALIMGGAIAAAPDAALAQAQQGVVVSRVIIQGNERIDPETIASYLPIAAGDTVDPAKIDVALKALFRTDLFSDVKIEMQGTDLVVKVVENPVINQVLFEGNSNIKEDKLKDEVQIRPRGVFTRAKVEEDVGRIVELYRRAGRISATVTPKIIELPQHRVDLIFEINEGPKSGILRTNFLGNNSFSSNDLKGVIVTKESKWYRFFSSNDNYDPDRIEYDGEQLRKYYRNRGFYDFRIISSVAELAPDKNGFAVTYALDEGARYHFGKLTVHTDLKKLNADILRALLPIREGMVYQDQKIEQATDALTFAAGAAGFAFVDVRPHYTPNPAKHTVDVVFDVKEGPRVYIDRIDIVGNTTTLDYVIRRQLNVDEGDAYNRALVDRSKGNLRGLGFFKDVDITNTPGAAPDRTNLLVHVTEQPTGQLNFSAGYSTVDKLVTDVGISQSNFRGRGQDVRARLELGSIEQQANISFTEPHWLNRNLQAGFDLFATRYDFQTQASYITTGAGGTVRAAFPLTSNSLLTTRYTLHSDDVIVNPFLCIPGQELVSVVLCTETGTFITSSVGYTLGMDARNDRVLTTRGYYINLSQDLAGMGGTVHYLRTVATGGWFYGFNKDYIFSFTGNAGYINGWNGNTIRINDEFYKGGDTFRGFQIAGIGPRDTEFGDALGGKLFAIGTVEMTLPTHLPEQYGIRAALFSDFGTLGLLDAANKVNPFTNQPISTVQDDLNLRWTAGISIFWKSPMGPLRFDFSQIIRKELVRQDSIVQFFHFNKVLNLMTKRLLTLGGASMFALTAVASVALAQAKPPAAALPPIAEGPPIPGLCVISINQAISTSTVGVYVTGRMNQIVAQVKAELGPQQSAIETDGRALEAKRSTLDAATFQTQAQAIQARITTLRQTADLRQREVQATEQKALNRIAQELDPIARQLYQTRHCSALLDKQSVLMANPDMDLTAQAITGLNGKIQQFAFDREHLDTAAAPAR